MLLSEVVEDFVQHLKVERGYTRSASLTYGSWSRHFIKYLQENGTSNPTLEDFNALTLKRYLYHLSGRKLRPRNIRSAFHPLKIPGAYLVSRGAETGIGKVARIQRLHKPCMARCFVFTDPETVQGHSVLFLRRFQPPRKRTEWPCTTVETNRKTFPLPRKEYNYSAGMLASRSDGRRLMAD